jgi:TRAP-type C4-dicarboxylate transport system substrate-binding protein
VADGPVGAELAKRIQQQAGFKVLGWWSTGDSAIETTKVPVRHPDDLKGLKIRVIENPALIDSLRALGASPTPMALPEVMLGLRQGVVDGAHLDAVLVDSMKAYESLKYITDWQKMTFLSEPRPVIMQAALFDKLPKRHQDAIMEGAREATALERKLFLERLAEVRARLVANGMTITDAPPGPFIERVRPVWDKYAKQLNADDLLQQIIAATPK